MRIRGWLPLAVAGIAGAVQAGDLRVISSSNGRCRSRSPMPVCIS